jgi:HPt (histidine-containing phosphotransfer) domain-containing protein
MDVPLVIDPATIKSLRTLNTGDNDDFLREIVALFGADLKVRLGELEQSLARGDRVTLERSAHSIKGSAANLGAGMLRAAAEAVEAHSRRSGLGEIAPLIDALKAEAARAQSVLEEILAAPPRSS